MKKISAILIALTMALFSCSKEEVDKSSEYRLNKLSEEDVLNFQDNNEDNKIRETSLIFGKALTELFQDETNIRLVINDAKESPLKEANLLRIANLNFSFKSQLNALLLKYYNSASPKSENDEMLTFLSSQLVYENVLYQPVIVIPNYNTLDVNLLPIVSGGVDLNDELDNRIDDDIFAYNLLDNGSFEEIYLSEEEAMSTQRPVLVFSNGIDDTSIPLDGQIFLDSYGVKSNSNNNSGNTDASTKRFDHMHVSIKSTSFHYDPRRQKNEYRYTGIYLHSSGWGWIWKTDQSSNLVRNFSKNDCNGAQYTDWGQVYYADTHYPDPTTEHYIAFNTFERDWAKSQKPLGNGTRNGYTGYLYGKMTFNDEWYLSDPNSAGGLVLTGSGAALWQYFDLQSYKTKFAITRTQ
jgi:hypothetical protein